LELLAERLSMVAEEECLKVEEANGGAEYVNAAASSAGFAVLLE
jgi:hypothetical protein